MRDGHLLIHPFIPPLSPSGVSPAGHFFDIKNVFISFCIIFYSLGVIIIPRTGRPAKKIDKKFFEKLCEIQCTEKEICSCFECCEDTLNAWCKKNYFDDDGAPMTFSDVFRQKREKGKASLRRAQIHAAENGNATMLIWLGKQYLDQKDEKTIEASEKVNIIFDV